MSMPMMTLQRRGSKILRLTNNNDFGESRRERMPAQNEVCNPGTRQERWSELVRPSLLELITGGIEGSVPSDGQANSIVPIPDPEPKSPYPPG
jgi:hypothetical protein